MVIHVEFEVTVNRHHTVTINAMQQFTRVSLGCSILLQITAIGCSSSMPTPPNPEQQLIRQIAAATGPERESLIQQLDSIAPTIYPLFDRWFLVYSEELPFTSWDDTGFHPQLSSWPADLQILWAATYSKSDIDNGGLYQYFNNDTGTYAPEFLDFLQRCGNQQAAEVLEQAMSFFGPEYPRSQAARISAMPANRSRDRSEWDPFYKLDNNFYSSFDGLDLTVDVCNDWLRNQCGIDSLIR